MPTTFVLNGKPATLDVDPTMPLLWAMSVARSAARAKARSGDAEPSASDTDAMSK